MERVLKLKGKMDEVQFKRKLSKITGKSERTVRRWFHEGAIPTYQLSKIADHFKIDPSVLIHGDRQSNDGFEAIMASDKYAAVIVEDGRATSMNARFIEWMDLANEEPGVDTCEIIRGKQNTETLVLCRLSDQLARDKGCHTHHVKMILGDGEYHDIEITTLSIADNKIIRIFIKLED